MKLLTREQVAERLRNAVEQSGSQKLLAEQWGVSTTYLSEVMRGTKEPGPKILEQMGLELVLMYREKV